MLQRKAMARSARDRELVDCNQAGQCDGGFEPTGSGRSCGACSADQRRCRYDRDPREIALWRSRAIIGSSWHRPCLYATPPVADGEMDARGLASGGWTQVAPKPSSESWPRMRRDTDSGAISMKACCCAQIAGVDVRGQLTLARRCVLVYLVGLQAYRVDPLT